jgi:hypothetical protein
MANPQTAPLIQGDTVQIAGGYFTVIGRDSHTHVHYHGSSDANTFQTHLQAIANHRKIQQDTLAKATPGTVEWLLKSRDFNAWWNVSADFQILWGSGIRECSTMLTLRALDKPALQPALGRPSLCGSCS